MRGRIKTQKHAHQNEFIRTIKLRRIARGGQCTLYTWRCNTSTTMPEQNCEMSKNVLLMHLSTPSTSWSILWPTIIMHAMLLLFSIEVSVLVVYALRTGWRDIAKHNALSMRYVEI